MIIIKRNKNKNKLKKKTNVTKIHFHSFWRAAAPRKAGKPIRLFSLMKYFACGL